MPHNEPGYLPIDCDQHSVLELLAMRRTPVELRASDPKGDHLVLRGVVSDVRTRDGAEYLEVRDAAANRHQVRLDRLLEIFDQKQNLLWCQKHVATQIGLITN